MERIEEKYFASGVVDLDGKAFVRCDFDLVALRFSGKSPVGLSHCSFGNVRWEFADSAALTMQFFGGLYSGAGDGGRKLVEKTSRTSEVGSCAVMPNSSFDTTPERVRRYAAPVPWSSVNFDVRRCLRCGG